jgi:hypothetical protein
MRITFLVSRIGYRSIKDVVLLKFETYRYYYRFMDFLENRDILPNILHSLIQQLVYQDPALYMLMVALRPDYAYRLMAIPYHIQTSRPRDNIVYRHLDVNLDRLVKHSQRNNIIQCAISFENEKAPNCTYVMRGMHH